MVTWVKVCGLTTLADAEHAAECGADALGFVFDPVSPRRVASPDIPSRLGPFRVCVGVFGTYEPLDTGCSTLQCAEGDPDHPFVRTVRMRAGASVETLTGALASERRRPVAVLLDAYVQGANGGTGHTVDWGLAAELVAALDLPVILAGGLHAGNVAQAIRQVRPYAVDASSGLELSPGVKDPGKVKAFIEAAKAG